MVVDRLRARWRNLLRVSVATSAVASTAFSAVTVVNGLVFDYDFFDDVAPSDRAELVATVSLITLSVLAAALATVAYGALVQIAHEETTPATAVRRAARRALRDAWFAVPLMVICGLLVVFVVPAFAVGPLAAIASQRITGRRARPGYVGRSLGRHVLAAAAPVAALALLWVVAAVASFAPVPAPLSALPSTAIAWTVVFVVSVVVALGASVTATASVVFLEEATDLAPWPPPTHRPGQWPDPWPQRPASVPVPRVAGGRRDPDRSRGRPVLGLQHVLAAGLRPGGPLEIIGLVRLLGGRGGPRGLVDPRPRAGRGGRGAHLDQPADEPMNWLIDDVPDQASVTHMSMSLRAIEMRGGMLGSSSRRYHWASRISVGSHTMSPLSQFARKPSIRLCGNGHGWLLT
jgi:hypothetical protein